MKKVKRLLSMVLVCCFIIGILPTPTFASGNRSLSELAEIINSYFSDHQWKDDDIISAKVSEGEGRFQDDENAVFILRAQTKSAEWTHAANVYIADVSINAITLDGYIDWGSEQEYIDFSAKGAQRAEFRGSTYQVFDGVCDSWSDAKAYCESLGGHLATITSQEENDFLYRFIIDSGYTSAYFGLTDEAEEGTWEWVTGETVDYTNWHRGEPNSENSGEDFAMFYWKYSDGTWNDGDFANKTVSGGRTFICEWDDATTAEFRFTSNTTINCIARNSTVDIYVGYYVDDVLTNSNYQAVIGDTDILQIKNKGWDSSRGQHFSLTAKKTGATTLTVTDPSTGATGSLDLNVVDSETIYSFDNVPKLTVENGKTTNFYNYSGMVVDDFGYKEVKKKDGTIDHYAVTMTVYNSLDLYGAITAYDAKGNIYDHRVIDKFTSMDSSFVDSAVSLIKSTGDLFYLIGNNKYYSGESISKKTEITSSRPIKVPLGGYLEISNNASSPVALFANLAGITIDFMATTQSLASSASKMLDAKHIIVDQLLIDAFTKDYASEATVETIKKLAKQELKNGNWSLYNFGDGIQSLFAAFTNSGIDFVGSLTEEIASVTGILSITESIAMDVIPTGPLIKAFYAGSDIGELIIESTAFNKSVDYPRGIYLYTSAFTDVSTKAYYSDPVQWALMNDITSGTSANTFGPDDPCTRAQAVTFLWRASGSPKPSSTKDPFLDVKPGAYYYDAVLWAVERGITSGTTSTTFSPNTVCDRSQIVTFLYRANGSQTANGSAFSDVPRNSYYSAAVNWAVAQGITSGTSNTTFSPNANCTRGQIVTFLYRAESGKVS